MICHEQNLKKSIRINSVFKTIFPVIPLKKVSLYYSFSYNYKDSFKILIKSNSHYGLPTSSDLITFIAINYILTYNKHFRVKNGIVYHTFSMNTLWKVAKLGSIRCKNDLINSMLRFSTLIWTIGYREINIIKYFPRKLNKFPEKDPFVEIGFDYNYYKTLTKGSYFLFQLDEFEKCKSIDLQPLYYYILANKSGNNVFRRNLDSIINGMYLDYNCSKKSIARKRLINKFEKLKKFELIKKFRINPSSRNLVVLL